MCDSNSNCNPNTNCDSLADADSYAYTQRDTNRHSYGYSDGYCNYKFNCYSHRNRNDDSDRNRYCNFHGNCYSDCHCQAKPYCKAPPNSEATSYSSATPLSKLAWRFWGAHAFRVLVSASTPKRTSMAFCR